MIIPVYQIGNTPGKGNAFFISIKRLKDSKAFNAWGDPMLLLILSENNGKKASGNLFSSQNSFSSFPRFQRRFIFA